jgi:dGTPase
LLQFSPAMRQQSSALKRFLFANLYRHPQVMQTTGQAKEVVTELFAAYVQEPTQMQAGFAAQAMQSADPDAAAKAEKPVGSARVVADYIAGMTDRFAAREHERLTGRKLLV